MRRLATGLLVAMGALFLLSHQLLGRHPIWGWVLAFSEAAMVGGLADWFAVTALFRRPRTRTGSPTRWRGSCATIS